MSPNAAQSVAHKESRRVQSPTHTKAATVSDMNFSDGTGSGDNARMSPITRTMHYPTSSAPFDTSSLSIGLAGAGLAGRGTPVSSQTIKEATKSQEALDSGRLPGSQPQTPSHDMSPGVQKVSPEHPSAGLSDSGSPNSISGSATTSLDNKNELAAPTPSNETRSRKVSEPPMLPPSLKAIFDPDNMGSSRRAMAKQTSAEDPIHRKQTSLDHTHLRAVHGSPKHGRRSKHPSLPAEDTNIKRTPSQPHLNSTTGSPQMSHYGLPVSGQPITRARSTQLLHLKVSQEEGGEPDIQRSYSGGKEDLKHTVAGITIKPVLEPARTAAMREESSNLRRTPSRESLKGKDSTPLPGKEAHSPQSSRDGHTPHSNREPQTTTLSQAPPGKEVSTPHSGKEAQSPHIKEAVTPSKETPVPHSNKDAHSPHLSKEPQLHSGRDALAVGGSRATQPGHIPREHHPSHSVKDVPHVHTNRDILVTHSVREVRSTHTGRELHRMHSPMLKESTSASAVVLVERGRAPSPSRDLSSSMGAEGLHSPMMGGSGSPSKMSTSEVRRRNNSQLRGDSSGRKERGRPQSMIETSSLRYGMLASLELNKGAPDLLAQLFWTSASLLESDYEGEFSMALRLLSKVESSDCVVGP